MENTTNSHQEKFKKLYCFRIYTATIKSLILQTREDSKSTFYYCFDGGLMVLNFTIQFNMYLPSAWRLCLILNNLEFIAKILIFLFLGKILEFLPINLVKKSKKNQDLGKKSKIMPLQIREENHGCFYKYKLGYKYFSS